MMTVISINNMLEHFGLSVPENRISARNTAAVIVTASMPAFAGPGSTFDVNVASVGDARSLEGGQLLMTPLVGADNRLYAIAQGPLTFGGFNVGMQRGVRERQHFTNVGTVVNGALVQESSNGVFIVDGELNLMLMNPNFTTAERAAEAINEEFGMRLATANNASNISVIVPDDVIMGDNIVGFISTIENLEVHVAVPARVVINERTGTIVAGGNIVLQEVAIAHGHLTVITHAGNQPPFGPYSFEARLADIEQRDYRRMFMIEGTTVAEISAALHAIRVTPREMIAIFQALHASGALMAELRII
jgi:flagellar P-ring protein precursor FlgI